MNPQSTPSNFKNPLYELASQLGSAEQALRQAAHQCPGDPALQGELLARAAWCKDKFNTVSDRITHGLARRLADNPRRS
ncbi:hypothetical protein [Paucibacter sp. Y2R2-4]|uniref:hypothetical protein n=1 Tax=Paucibacter sp. Y2R2-4 TaxID=2893553 RepID=UPI0021E4BF12|nr:hypothetical protein [Paucibacter sp. Y2R2-4]MCV2349316.1 hypothetical protein [Paucibacter sp. Y2R2-4]